MTLYPSEKRQQRATIVRDALVVASLALLAWLGRRVYVLVDDGPPEAWRYEFVVTDPG